MTTTRRPLLCRARALLFAAAAAATGLLLSVLPVGAASAHSLESSTIAVRLGDTTAEATISVALETLDATLGTGYAATETLTDADLSAITDYLLDHMTATGTDGTVWSEAVTGITRTEVEGFDTINLEVVFGTGGVDPSGFTLAYDAVIATAAGHEAVVVLTDATGEISTAGVITANEPTLVVGDTLGTGLLDMVGYGFEHVLEGADHLLFLFTLVLVAPLTVVAGRWSTRPDRDAAGRRSWAGSLRSVVAVVTAFTVGHSLTLIASALGWLSLDTTLVEVLVAASVAVAAVHAIHPLFRRGEVVIAGIFGLVHGLAFAGTLANLGFDGSLGVITLLAFDVGVELAGLLTVALVVPSLLVIARTRWAGPVRLAIAGVALGIALVWIADRLGLIADPLANGEEWLVAHAWIVAVGLGVIAVVARELERRRVPSDASTGERIPAAVSSASPR